MRRFLYAAALLFPLAAHAQMGLPLNVGSSFVPSSALCPRGATFVDGCPSATAGTPNFPLMLTGYTNRPPWNVAGADYYVGVPIGTVLANPSTISQAGVTVNATSHTVTITGNNVTLSGYDFGANNGWRITVQGVNDAILNSSFAIGSNFTSTSATMVNVASSASGLSFLNNSATGNSFVISKTGGACGLICVNGGGTFTAQYNNFFNMSGDPIDFNLPPSAQTNNIRYNLFNNVGISAPHGDTTQYYNGRTAASDVGFNTVYMTADNTNGFGNGLLNLGPSEGGSSNLQNISHHNNTLISLVACAHCNWADGYYEDTGGVGSFLTIHDNYVDPTGINSFTGSPWFGNGGAGLTSPMSYYNLTNMVTGSTIAVPTSTSPTSQGYYVYTTGGSPAPTLSSIYTITPSPASGNVTTGQTINFTLAMNEPTTVTGTPTMALNDGGTATYVSGSGTKSLVFSHTVGAGNSATQLAVTSVTGSMKDNVGNVTVLSPLTNLTTTWPGLSVNGTPTIGFTILSGGAINSTTTGTGPYTGPAPTGLVSPASFGNGCAGPSTVTGFSASGGFWNATFTTPTVPCTGTLAVTGTGPNTGSAVSPARSFSPPSTSITCSPISGSLTAPVATGTTLTSCTVAPSNWNGVVNLSNPALVVATTSATTFNLNVGATPLAAGPYSETATSTP